MEGCKTNNAAPRNSQSAKRLLLFCVAPPQASTPRAAATAGATNCWYYSFKRDQSDGFNPSTLTVRTRTVPVTTVLLYLVAVASSVFEKGTSPIIISSSHRLVPSPSVLRLKVAPPAGYCMSRSRHVNGVGSVLTINCLKK